MILLCGSMKQPERSTTHMTRHYDVQTPEVSMMMHRRSIVIAKRTLRASSVVLRTRSCWQSSVKGVHCRQVTAMHVCTTMWQCCTADECLLLSLRSPAVDATINTSWHSMLIANVSLQL